MQIAMVAPVAGKLSETFIAAQQEKLFLGVPLLYGGNIPTHCTDNPTPLVDQFGLAWKMVWIAQRLIEGSDYSFSIRKAFVKKLKSLRVTHVLVQYGTTAARIHELLSDENIGLIVHFHGYDAYKYSVIERFGEEYRKVFARASLVVAVSDDMRTQLINLGCPAGRILVNPCAPADCFFKVTPAPESPRFLFVGRFVDKKSPHSLLYAFSRVLQQHPDAELVMAGDGPLLNSVRELSTLLACDQNVTFPGAVSQARVMKLMASSFCYVQHSVRSADGDSEGTPVSILEASASSLPVISTYHAGIADAVLDGQTGLLVQERDLDGMVRAMVAVFEDRSYASKLGIAGRQHMLQGFSMIGHIEKLERSILNACT